MKIPAARELAILCMIEVEEKQILVNQGFAALGVTLKPEDMSLAHELVYGTFRFLDSIDEILDELCRKPLASLPLQVQWILRSGVYQLLHMRTPAYAILNESVTLTGQMGFKGLKPVVNAILRNVQRKFPTRKLTHIFIPDWFREVLCETYGEENVLEWTEAWSRPPVLSYWSLEEGSDEPTQTDEPFSALPHAKTGKVDLTKRNYVQNESAQAMAELVIRSGCREVLDYCAAPGGKSAYLGAFGTCDRLLATDISSRRTQTMLDNFKKMKLDIKTQMLPLEETQSFDFVLVDAPCSALGILARHPEIAFLRREGANKELLHTQKAILDEAWSFVKPGGTLFYVICTLDPAELPTPPSDAVFVEESLREWMPPGIPCEYTQNGGFYIPPDHRYDGFSGFLIRKTGSPNSL